MVNDLFIIISIDPTENFEETTLYLLNNFDRFSFHLLQLFLSLSEYQKINSNSLKWKPMKILSLFAAVLPMADHQLARLPWWQNTAAEPSAVLNDIQHCTYI